MSVNSKIYYNLRRTVMSEAVQSLWLWMIGEFTMRDSTEMSVIVVIRNGLASIFYQMVYSATVVSTKSDARLCCFVCTGA